MIPFYLMLAGMGLLAIGNEPKHPSVSRNRQPVSQSVYSVHNYKQPFSAVATQRNANQSEMAVNKITAQPVNYKHQRSVAQPAGTITLEHTSVVNSSMRNYKNQRSVKSIDTPQQPTSGN